MGLYRLMLLGNLQQQSLFALMSSLICVRPVNKEWSKFSGKPHPWCERVVARKNRPGHAAGRVLSAGLQSCGIDSVDSLAGLPLIRMTSGVSMNSSSIWSSRSYCFVIDPLIIHI